MENGEEQISQLLAKLELLLKKQQDFNIEVNEIRRDIQILRNSRGLSPSESAPDSGTAQKSELEAPAPSIQPAPVVNTAVATPVQNTPPSAQTDIPEKIKAPKVKSNIEKFIGENLINKIGILITIIGVVIGAKYSIENNLISPLTRIILGYLVGLGLLGFGIRLKSKYLHYSAVLVSGALAILYFITFAAYDLYQLITQLLAFGIMLVFTAFGVVTALHYNKQIIAHIGLVGAYAVPYLLSDGSGAVFVLFTYIAIINLGILIIAFKKYWKPLYYSAFGFTWLIYFGWLIFSSNPKDDFTLGMLFLSIFFLSFYAVFLAFKLLKTEKFNLSDIVLLLLNSFLFYGSGIYLIEYQEQGEAFLGLFTLVNAIIHFTVAFIIYKRNLADKNLFYLAAGLVLTFVTIAIPVQLDGNWVTLLWVFEAALLFWIGRAKNVHFYENVSYVLMILTLFSLLIDWGISYDVYLYGADPLTPFFNSTLLTSLLCAASFGFIRFIQTKSEPERNTWASKLMSVGIPIVLISLLYGAFYLEIGYYWNLAVEDSAIPNMVDSQNQYDYMDKNYALRDFGTIWLLNYTLLFLTSLILLNLKVFKQRPLGVVTLSMGLFLTLLFLTSGLYALSELREAYLNTELTNLFEIGTYYIWIRYLAFLFFALFMVAMYQLIRQEFMKIKFNIPFELTVHTSILWILSSELLNWMDLVGSDQSYKLGLSILWGLYALMLIVLGIWKNKKYLRVGAIALFSMTLLKLFFYDIASLNTISKTIVFVSLGILLLIISFLYTKYRHVISDENEN